MLTTYQKQDDLEIYQAILEIIEVLGRCHKRWPDNPLYPQKIQELYQLSQNMRHKIDTKEYKELKLFNLSTGTL